MENLQIKSLAQRGLYYFLVTYSQFQPIISETISEKEQENAHQFILHIYLKLFHNPSLIGLKDYPDDNYDDWVQQKEKPGLDGKIRKYIIKTEEYIEFLCNIALNGTCYGDTIKIPTVTIQKSRAFINKLSMFDINVDKTEEYYIFEFPNKTASGLKLLAEISVEHYKQSIYKNSEFLLFSRGCFDIEKGFTRDVFMKIADNKEAFVKLLEFLDNNEYLRIENKCFQNQFSQVSLDYIKFYGDLYDKIPSGWGERTHGGIEIVYEEIRKYPFLITLRIPYFGKLLENTESMEEKLKKFITTVSKKCDNCGYCTQTDKTGNRPKSYVCIDEYQICPLFCGFQYRWRRLDTDLVDNIIEMLKYIDSVFSHKKEIN